MNNRKKIKTGTLGKLSRRVRRNQAHALKARGKREKAMCKKAFSLGVEWGSAMFQAKVLNATAGMQYEEEPNVQQTSCSDLESDGVLATPVDSAVDCSIENTLPTLAPQDAPYPIFGTT